jgi:hypothetical protein
MAKKEGKIIPKYEVPFVNDGEAFDFPIWTNRKHKEVLAKVAKYQDELPEKELDEKYRRVLVLAALKDIDPSVTEGNLDDLHPDDLLSLFTAAYLSGRKGIISKDFQKAQKKSLEQRKSNLSQAKS